VVLSCCACKTKAPHFVILQLELVLNLDFYLLLFPSTARKKCSLFNTKVSNWRLSFKCSWIPWLCILQTLPVFYFVT
jgi:hypothetical protein